MKIQVRLFASLREAAGQDRLAVTLPPDATVAQLRKLGSVEAAVRVRPHSLEGGAACRSALCGLEGAVRGVRWHAIPADQRDRLWRAHQRRREA